MNLFERLAAKAAWGRMEAKMPTLKKYAPLVGSAVLVSVVVLRLMGYVQAAAAVETLGGVVGVTQQSPVGVGELVAAGAALTGIVLKVKAEVQKARAGN